MGTTCLLYDGETVEKILGGHLLGSKMSYITTPQIAASDWLLGFSLGGFLQ